MRNLQKIDRAVLDDRSEKQVQADIVKVLRYLSYHVSDLSQPRASMQTPGLPDLYAQSPRWRVTLWIEVKKSGGRLTPAQTSWHTIEAASGGRVLTARSGADVHDYLTNLHRKIEKANLGKVRARMEKAPG